MSPSNISVTSIIHNIITHHYPNDVTYHCVYHEYNLTHQFSCDVCQEMGIPWLYAVTEAMLVNHINPPQMIAHQLTEHALQHNALVQRIRSTFNFTRKHQGVVGQFPSSHGHGCPVGHQGVEGHTGLPPLDLSHDFDEWEEELVKELHKKWAEVDKKSIKKPNEYRRIELDEEKDKT